MPGVKHKQQWFQNFRCVIPTVEVKRLKTGERKRVLGVVEEEAILSTAGPAVQTFFQLGTPSPLPSQNPSTWNLVPGTFPSMRRRFIADTWSPQTGHPTRAALTGDQIGRASCRERV